MFKSILTLLASIFLTLSVNANIISASASNGMVSVSSSGKLQYTPDPNFHGTDKIIYKISDGVGGYSEGEVNVTVKDINDSPVANDFSLSVMEDSAYTHIDFKANTSDVDSIDLQITPDMNGVSGHITNSTTYTADGPRHKKVYKPKKDWNGTDIINYTVSDGIDTSAPATATVEVIPVNDPATGNVIVAGTTKSGETLTASNTLADVDGMGTVSYSWSADGVAITGANQSTYTLTDAEVGKKVTVEASFTDGDNNAEAKSSVETAVIEAATQPPAVEGPWKFSAEVMTAAQASTELYGSDFTGGNTSSDEQVIKLTLNVDMARVTDNNITSIAGSEIDLTMDWTQFEALQIGAEKNFHEKSDLAPGWVLVGVDNTTGAPIKVTTVSLNVATNPKLTVVDNVNTNPWEGADRPSKLDSVSIYLNPKDNETDINLTYQGKYSANQGEIKSIDIDPITLDIL